MPVKKGKSKSNNFVQVKFVNYRFDAETKVAFEKWYGTKEQLFVPALVETLQGDHKISVSWDDEKECYIAAMTGKETSLNPGMCLTVRAGDWVKALAGAAYVHTIVFSGEVWEVDETVDVL